MSCIVGLWRRDAVPVERDAIEQLLAQVRRRAPDGNQIHCDVSLGLGQAFLRTGRSPAEGPNRLTLDGRVWITADARLDGRAALVRTLRGAGRQVDQDAPHAELILHAYHAFGDGLLGHLMGDFAFAIWDAGRQRLLCARDHFGVRPFYYFEAGGVFGFASDMNALRTQAQVSRRLDPTSVVDFLLVGLCQEAGQTIYSDIRCLPPATCMALTAAGSTLRRYWNLPRPKETRCRSRAEYAERFKELFTQAVTDRLPSGPLALQLSGGMDSTAIAAVAAGAFGNAPAPATAYHLSCASVEPGDDEGRFAQLVADHLKMPMVWQDVGDFPLFAPVRQAQLAFPLAYPHLALRERACTRIEDAGARVLFSGYSGDAAMMPSRTYYSGLLRGGRTVKFAREVAHHVRHARSLRGMSLRTMLPARAKTPPWKPPLPDWLDQHAAGADVPGRWEKWWADYQTAGDADSQLRLPWLHRQFEADELLNFPLVVRYPFHDLRLLEFLMGLPSFMLQEKAVLREAMHDELPPPVLARPKTALAGDHLRRMVTCGNIVMPTRDGGGWPVPLVTSRLDAAFERFRNGDGANATWAPWMLLQSVAFAGWLAQNEAACHE